MGECYKAHNGVHGAHAHRAGGRGWTSAVTADKRKGRGEAEAEGLTGVCRGQRDDERRAGGDGANETTT